MYRDSNHSPREKSTSGSCFLARPKMGALKNLYSALNSKYPKSPIRHEKKKRNKKCSPSANKMEYSRKKPDYAETAYREAVGRLRIFLAESYSPRRRTCSRDMANTSAGEETDNQSVISVISRSSRYPAFNPPAPRKLNPLSSQTIDTKDRFDTSPELAAFMDRQEDYIEQLERESRFCREELSALLGKVKEVIQENDSLHEMQKNKLLKSVLDQFETETETDNNGSAIKVVSKSRQKRANWEGPSIVYESRISELEAQLTQARIDLRKATEEKSVAYKKYSDSDEYNDARKQLEAAQSEKSMLQETVTKLQSALNLLRDKEHCSTGQVKRSLDIAEQAQYEKNTAEHEIRRLKDELERQHGKLRDSINEQSRRVADERANVERRYSQQIEQLSSELGVHWEQSNKLQMELDKQKRENTDMRREVTQKQALIDELRKEMQNKIITLQSDIGISGAEKSALEQQIASLQMANERSERQGKQEAARLHVEMQSLRQRLDRADADLIHSRRENVRLSDQIASLEKEINMNNALVDEKSKIIALPAPKAQQEKERDDTSSKIQQLESKHAATVAELEGMIQSQNQLMDKLSAECHALTQKLDESSTRHKMEIRQLQSNLDCLSNKFTQAEISMPSMSRGNGNAQHNVEQNAPTQAQAKQPSEEMGETIEPGQQEYYNYQNQPYQESDQQYQFENQPYMTQEQYEQQYAQYQQEDGHFEGAYEQNPNPNDPPLTEKRDSSENNV